MAEIAVGFDFDHTLAVDNRLERTVALELLATLAKEQRATYDVAAAEGTIDTTLASYRSGSDTVDTAIEAYVARFLDLGNALADVGPRFRDSVVARVPQFVQPLPGMLDLLAALDAMGVRYALLTNGWSPLQEEKARLVGFAAPVLVSERIGARKPSRDAFAKLAAHFGLGNGSIWYVGDDPAGDCAAARAVGMTAVWFNWEGRSYPSDLTPPDHTIHALGELSTLLQGRVSAAAKPLE